MFIVHCSCSLFIVPTVLLSSLMIFFIQSWAKLNGEDVQAYIQTTKEFTTWGANSSTSEMESGPDS